MDSKSRHILRLGAPLVLVLAALLGLIVLLNGTALAERDMAPRGAPRAALPTTPCVTVGSQATCELWAVTGTLSLPDGATVPIWGYSASAEAGSAQIPGPTLIVTEGVDVDVILHNGLGETTAMVFPGQAMMPDLEGVPPGGTTTYSFNTSSPGTYLYEAGLLPNAQHQVAMGLYGGLVVRPELGATYAYSDTTTMFDDETLLVLSDIDPALNTSADPAAFEMRDYAPTYFLINGQAYPDTEEIPSLPGYRILLRTVNAGVVQHPLGVLGMHQEIIATDGHALTYPYQVAAATVGSGQTSDRIVTVPDDAGTAGDSRYAVYDTSMLLHNDGAAGFGGMLTFIFVPDGAGFETGPTTTAVEVAPNPTDGSEDVILTATIPGATEAEYFIDWVGVAGGGTAMSAGADADEWTATISITDLEALASGYHTIYVHGSDGTTWGPFNFDVLHLDKLGPATIGLTLTPNPSNGAVSVTVSATGDDRATGNSVIEAAEYFIDATGADGSGTPLTVNVAQSIASVDGLIDAATMGGLAEGDHTIYVHSMDVFGWWGDYVTDTLVVDQTGPTTSDVVVDPSPNNGALPYNPTRYAVRVDATVTDTDSAIERAEGFIDTVGADGSGFPLTPADALFDELVEDAYAYIPLSTINQLAEGTHQIWIHGQDAAGNWGVAAAGDLVIDKTGPTVTNVNADPNPTRNETIVTLTADAADNALTIVRAEWFDGGDPGPGNGTPMEAADGNFDSETEGLTATIDVSGWAPGDHIISVRARDAAGNWSDAATTLLCVRACGTIFADSFASGDTTAWTATTGDVTVIAAAAMDDDGFGMAANIGGAAAAGVEPQSVDSTDGAYVTDETPEAETSYHARFAFDPNGAQSPAGSEITLLEGQDGGGATLFKVEYRRLDNGDAYQVRGVVMTAGGQQTTAWVDIEDGATNFIEIGWEAGTSASFDLYVDNWLEENLTGLDTSAYALETVHMGPSGGIGLDGDGVGWVHLDVFESTRYEVIGAPYQLWLPLVMQGN